MPHGFRSSFSIQPSKPSMDTAFGGPTLASIRTSITCFELSRSASADSVELMVMEDTRLFQTDPLPGLVEINLSSRVQSASPATTALMKSRSSDDASALTIARVPLYGSGAQVPGAPSDSVLHDCPKRRVLPAFGVVTEL